MQPPAPRARPPFARATRWAASARRRRWRRRCCSCCPTAPASSPAPLFPWMEDALPDPTRFAGKVAIVTGAAGGIGAATAARLAAEGAQVLLADREPDFAAPPGAVTCVVDITSPDAGKRLAEAALDAFGRIDILVNNAGIGGSRPLLDSDDALISRFVDTNLTAVLRVTRDVLPHLTLPGGCVVN